MVKPAALLTTLVVALTASACNAVLGIEEGTFRGDAGGSGGTVNTGGSGGTGGSAAGGSSVGGSGGGVTSDCPPWDPDVACAPNLSDDPDNCCLTGRSCQGGSCVDGHCTPVLLDAAASTDTRGIDVTGDRIYWSTGSNQLIKSRLGDGSGYLEVASDTNYMPSLATDDTHAYWTEWMAGNVMRAPLDGGGVSELVGSVSATAGWGRIDVAATRVFWATKNGDIGVWAAPIDNLTGDVFAVASEVSLSLSVQEVVEPTGVMVDDTHVYFSDSSAGLILRRLIDSVVAKNDIAAEVVANNQGGAGDLAVDESHVYWVTSSEIRRCPKAGGAVETLAAAQDGPNALVVDDAYVTWVNRGDLNPPTGSVQRVRKTGGSLDVLATGQKSPWEIAQDCTTIYWTNHNDFGIGEIWKVAK